MVKYFEDFIVGDEYTYEATYTVTEAEIREIGERFDPSPSTSTLSPPKARCSVGWWRRRCTCSQ
jgi:hypothetical protein